MSRFLSRIPLYGRFTLVGAVIVVSTVGIMLLAHISAMRAVLTERTQSLMDERAAVYSLALLGPLVQGDYAGLDALIEGLRDEAGMSYIAVFDERGTAVAHAGIEVPSDLPPAMRDVRQAFDEDVRIFHVEVPLKIEQQTYGRLRYGTDFHYVTEAKTRMVRDTLLLGLGALVVAVLSFGLLSFLVTRQLRHLTTHGSRLAAGDYAARLDAGSGDEMGRLAQAFNELAGAVEVKIASLSQSESRFRGLVETSSDWIWEVDAQGRYTYASPQSLKLLGYASEEVLGKTPFDFMPPEEARRVGKLFIDIIAARQPFSSLENRNLSKDGREVWLETSGTPILDADGALLGYRGIDRDITERKQAEAELEHQRQLYWVLSEVNESIVRAHGRYELFRSVCQTAVESGLFRMAWVGMLDETGLTVQPYVTWGFDEGYTDHLGIRMDVPGPDAGPVVAAFRDGNEFIVQDIANDPFMVPWREAALRREFRAMAVYPIREGGRPIGNLNVYSPFVGFFTEDVQKLMSELAADLSYAMDFMAETRGRREAEAGLRTLNAELEQRVQERTRQLAAANKELEAFSYSVSHDLRAPLRSIDGFSQILLTRYHEQLDAQGQDYLSRIRRASQRMGDLIDDMLRLSKVTRATLRIETVDLSALAQSVVEELQRREPGRAIDWVIEAGLEVQGDPGLLRAVLDNLLGNAWKFTANRAQARIEFGRAEVPGEAAFCVRDNGAGFNMDYVHKLFGAFQRLHSANEFEGTGIGLATVQRIIARHGGRVWAEGGVDQGARFYFTLGEIGQ